MPPCTKTCHRGPSKPRGSSHSNLGGTQSAVICRLLGVSCAHHRRSAVEDCSASLAQMKTLHFLHTIWSSSPSDIAFFVRRKIRRLTNPGAWDWDYSWDSIVRNPKLKNSHLHIENWERLWRVIQAKGHGDLRQLFGFQEKTVLEVGCGPLLGWGPM